MPRKKRSGMPAGPEHQFSEAYNAEIPFKSEKSKNYLLWDKKFFLRTSVEVFDENGNAIGSILTERNMEQLTDALYGQPEQYYEC